MRPVRVRLLIFTTIVNFSSIIFSAFSFSHSIGGYIEDLPFVSFPSTTFSSAGMNNLLQFRLNTEWDPFSSLAIVVDGRVLWYGGQDFENGAMIAEQLRSNPGYLDMGWAQGSNEVPMVLYENIDRLSVSSTLGKLTATAGRQRINWGTNLIWNPNDWYNAFNYLDFAYPEHPGADALRFQYYPNSTTVVELALQAGKAQVDRTFAALYKCNKWAYDWQFQGGLSGNDLACGFSWSGSIRGGGFRGELSYYYPVIDRESFDDQEVVTSISYDYTFSNSLYLQFSGLYNGFGAPDSSSVSLTTLSRVTAKSLIPKRYALYGEIAYQLTPLWHLDFAASVSPTDGSLYLSPAVTISVLDNLDLLFLGQIFIGKPGDLYGGASDIVTASLKWSF